MDLHVFPIPIPLPPPVLFLKSLFALIFDQEKAGDPQKLCYRVLCAETEYTMKMSYINGK